MLITSKKSQPSIFVSLIALYVYKLSVFHLWVHKQHVACIIFVALCFLSLHTSDCKRLHKREPACLHNRENCTELYFDWDTGSWIIIPCAILGAHIEPWLEWYCTVKGEGSESRSDFGITMGAPPITDVFCWIKSTASPEGSTVSTCGHCPRTTHKHTHPGQQSSLVDLDLGVDLDVCTQKTWQN